MPKADAPRFRFHGAKPPTAGSRTAILASAPVQGGDSLAATLRLYDPIDSWGGDWGVSAAEFASVMDELEGVQQINLHINSPGGDVFDGLAILNQLRQHPANVTATVDGLAASAVSFIACGVDELVMAPNSQMMIHDASGIVIGNAQDMTDFAGLLNKVSDNIASVYAAKAGTPAADWRTAMQAESWYTADEAAAAGLADRVDSDGTEQPTNRWDLSIFAHAGRDDAPTPPIPVLRAGLRMLTCGCGADVPGVQHKDECTAGTSPNNRRSARHRLVAARHRMPLS